MQKNFQWAQILHKEQRRTTNSQIHLRARNPQFPSEPTPVNPLGWHHPLLFRSEIADGSHCNIESISIYFLGMEQLYAQNLSNRSELTAFWEQARVNTCFAILRNLSVRSDKRLSKDVNINEETLAQKCITRRDKEDTSSPENLSAASDDVIQHHLHLHVRTTPPCQMTLIFSLARAASIRPQKWLVKTVWKLNRIVNTLGLNCKHSLFCAIRQSSGSRLTLVNPSNSQNLCRNFDGWLSQSSRNSKRTVQFFDIRMKLRHSRNCSVMWPVPKKEIWA